MSIRGYSPYATVKQPDGRSRGLSLIEVLIALLVLSIGLVGMAALHLNALQGTHSSYYRSIASSIALDLEERLWVHLAHKDLFSGCLSGTDVGEVITQLEQHWSSNNQELSVSIPNLSVSVNGDITIDVDLFWTEVPIRVSWAEGRFGDEGNLEEFFYTTRIVCGLSVPPDPG